jgi:hypothetical protein
MISNGSVITDGPHCGSDPVVGWAHDTTVRPPGGAIPVGTTTVPDTPMSFPLKSVEW